MVLRLEMSGCRQQGIAFCCWVCFAALHRFYIVYASTWITFNDWAETTVVEGSIKN